MIHNGIIENYADIKKNLIAKGVEFKSETDTEVLVQLIEYIQIKKNLDLLTAVQVALRQVIRYTLSLFLISVTLIRSLLPVSRVRWL